jgi:hypothetical protein
MNYMNEWRVVCTVGYPTNWGFDSPLGNNKPLRAKNPMAIMKTDGGDTSQKINTRGVTVGYKYCRATTRQGLTKPWPTAHRQPITVGKYITRGYRRILD